MTVTRPTSWFAQNRNSDTGPHEFSSAAAGLRSRSQSRLNCYLCGGLGNLHLNFHTIHFGGESNRQGVNDNNRG